MTITPDHRCSFVRWSDGSTDNPRSDVLTDNLTVSAEIRCSSPGGTSVTHQVATLEAMGKQADADALRAQYPHLFTEADTTTAPRTMADTLKDVRTLTEAPLPPIDPVRDRAAVQELIALLLELVQLLTKMLTGLEPQEA